MTMPNGYDLDDGERTPELLRELAAERGCTAVFADATTIQVDLDSESLDRFHTSYDLLQRGGYLIGSRAECWRSKSDNWHVVVTMPEDMRTTAQQRIMYALMLGSDPTREILNMTEARDGTGTIVLFMPIGSVIYQPGARAASDRKRRPDTELIL